MEHARLAGEASVITAFIKRHAYEDRHTMHRSINLLVGCLLLLPLATSANIIHTTGSITANGEGSVAYTLFDQNAPGWTGIYVNSWDFDTYVYLFESDGYLDSSDYITRNDDGGLGLNSFIGRVLNAGSYILAVSDYYLSLSEALSGYNSNNYYGDYSLTIASRAHVGFPTSSVPEPTTLSLLGLGLLGAGLFRRRMKTPPAAR
ncbi:MAG: DVUA0089 family protein [Candidatus Thiodiazotropha endolucinida]